MESLLLAETFKCCANLTAFLKLGFSKRALSGLRHFWQFKTLKNDEKYSLIHLKSSFYSHRNRLIRKIRLILKFMTSLTGKQAIVIDLLANISRCKSNQTLKFGQFIKYNTRGIFLRKHTGNLVEKLFSDLFSKKSKLRYLWINTLKFYTICFYCMPSWGLSKYIETKLQNLCFYLI